MDFNQIIALVASIMPALTTFFTSIGIYVGLIKKMANLRQNDTETIKNLENNLSIIIKENYELRKNLGELLTHFDRVKRSPGNDRHN